jgi:LPXTG-motif cell wall-anchored protein
MASRWLSRAAAAAAGIVVLATPGLAAAADPLTVPLHDDHKNSTAAGFGKHECTGPFADLPDGVDGWHFVLTGSNSFVELRLTFNPGGVAVTIDKTQAAGGNSGPGWSGYLDNAGAAEKHAYVFTTAGWTLVDGDADVTSGATNPPDFFNLSHTCPGTVVTTPAPTTQPPGTTTPPSTTTSTTPGDDPDLPVTGASVGGIAVAGLILLVGGTALLLARRRRDAVDGGEV